MNESDLVSFWKEEEVAKFQDIELINEAALYRRETELEWDQLKPIFEKYPETFPGVTKDVFFLMYNFACTRCFGWTLPATMMVPMADFVNHLPVDT